jgi:DNA-binding MarR family transcriptional regulator
MTARWEQDRVERQPIGYVLAASIFRVYEALQLDIAKPLMDLRLTESLAAVLSGLDAAGRPLARRAVAERLRCDPSNVTALVDRLEERGLVDRFADQTDRRVKAIALTPLGIATRARLAAAVADNATFARLTAKQQSELARLLARCSSAVTENETQHPADHREELSHARPAEKPLTSRLDRNHRLTA